eukprot:Clim_evm11s213 gene=Clim_evmTU11s213
MPTAKTSEIDIAGKGPQMGIQSVRFAQIQPDASVYHLAVSSWDCTFRVLKAPAAAHKNEQGAEAVQQISSYKEDAPVLDGFVTGDATRGYAGGVQGVLRKFYPAEHPNIAGQTIGRFNDAVSCVASVTRESDQLIVAGSTDRTARVFDTRTDPRDDGAEILRLQHDQPIYALDCVDHTLITATAEREIYLWDLRMLASEPTPVFRKVSPLKHQTRSVALFPNRHGYAIGSVEGRVAVEYMTPEVTAKLNLSHDPKKNYAFKGHRVQDPQEGDMLYPVNAIAFNPHDLGMTFATGGSDGHINIWNSEKKKRVRQLWKMPTSISSLSYSPDGQAIAFGVSNLWENGEPTPGGGAESVRIRYLDH